MKATRKKLERTLDHLESFLYSEDVDQVVTKSERQGLEAAVHLIRSVESRLFHE